LVHAWVQVGLVSDPDRRDATIETEIIGLAGLAADGQGGT
jgi:hypothetical protein